MFAALSYKRERANEGLPDTCVIYSVSHVSGGYGKEPTYALENTESCRFATLSGRELERAGQVAADADTAITLPANTPVQSKYRVVVTRAEDGAIFDLQVEHVNKRSQEIVRRVLCQDLTPDTEV